MTIFSNIWRRGLYCFKNFRWSKASLGPGSFIELSAKISNSKNTILGENSYISHNVIITNDYGIVKLGNKSHIAPGCVINCYRANLIIGSNVAIGPTCCLIAHSNKYEPNKLITDVTISKDIIIEDNVFIGANSVILPGIKIEKNSIVAAGAVVTQNVPFNIIVGGIPAKRIKERIY